jgi:hypothetical protein
MMIFYEKGDIMDIPDFLREAPETVKKIHQIRGYL